MFQNIPNILTFLRIVSIPLIVGILALKTGLGDFIAFILYIASCITDYLDGALARRWSQFSELGRMMDPIADKLLIGALLLVFAGFGYLTLYALYAAIIIMLREIMISGLREYMALYQEKVPSTLLAKWKTSVQMFALGFLVLGDRGCAFLGIGMIHAYDLGSILLWFSALLTVLSAWGYLRAGWIHINR